MSAKVWDLDTYGGVEAAPRFVVCQSDYDAIRAERDALRKDAERYRWLWKRVDTAPAHGLYPWRNGFDMDAAIDAALAERTP